MRVLMNAFKNLWRLKFTLRTKSESMPESNGGNSLYSPLERFYLRLMFTSKKRKALYNNLVMLLDAGVSVFMALEQIQSKYRKYSTGVFGKNKLFVKILADWLYRYRSLGYSLDKAISDYIPSTEVLLISSDTKDIKNGLKQALDISDKMNKIRSTLMGNMAYPFANILVLFGLLFFVSFKMMPEISTIIPPATWPPITKSLYNFSHFFVDNLLYILLAIFVLVIWVVYALPRTCGVIRRKILDKVAPFSVYKKLQSVNLLISLSLLLSSGNSFSKAISLLRGEASAYISYYLVTIIGKLKRGKTPGKALCDSELFDQESAVLIEIYSDTNSFEAGLHSLANAGMETQVKRIATASKLAGNVVLFVVFLFVVWTYVAMISFSSAIHS